MHETRLDFYRGGLDEAAFWSIRQITSIYFADDERNRKVIDLNAFMSEADSDTHMSDNLGHKFGLDMHFEHDFG